MNYANRKHIPLRPSPEDVHEKLLASAVKAAVYMARNAGKDEHERPRLGDNFADALISRSPVLPAKIADASGLTQIAVEFVRALVASSASGELIGRSLQLSFDGRQQISVPAMTLPDANFIGEASPIGVNVGTTSAGALLSPFKLASILTFTNEMLASSSIEAMTRALLLEKIGPVLDKAMLATTAATTIRPPGILNGVAALTPSSAAASIDALTADLAALIAALAGLAGGSPPILIAAPQQYTSLCTLPVDVPFDDFYMSPALAAGTALAVIPQAVATIIEMPRLELAPSVAIHLDSSALEIVSASPVVIAAPTRSSFQEDFVALRFILPISWAMRSATGVVAWLQNITKW
jgi:hypothetical protein